MPWVKGQSGNPGGKRKGVWREALERVSQQMVELPRGEKVTKLEAVAYKVFELAMDGDMTAVQEIGQRLDGKPAQIVETVAEDGAVQYVILGRAPSPSSQAWAEEAKP